MISYFLRLIDKVISHTLHTSLDPSRQYPPADQLTNHSLTSHELTNCIQSILLTAFLRKHYRIASSYEWVTRRKRFFFFTGWAWDYVVETLYIYIYFFFLSSSIYIPSRTFLLSPFITAVPSVFRQVTFATPRITSRSRVPVYSPYTFNRGVEDFQPLLKPNGVMDRHLEFPFRNGPMLWPTSIFGGVTRIGNAMEFTRTLVRGGEQTMTRKWFENLSHCGDIFNLKLLIDRLKA